MATTIAQVIGQLEIAGAHVTASAFIDDTEKFDALATMRGAKVKVEWIDRFDGRQIRESFEVRVGEQLVVVAHHRKPTVRDWDDVAKKRDELDPKAVRL